MKKLGGSAFLSLALGLALLALPAVAQSGYGQNSYPQNQQYPNQNGAYNNGYGAPNAIPEGTRFMAVLDDKLDTKKIKGHVSSIDRGFRGRVLLSFDQIETKHGWVPLIASVSGVPGEHGVDQNIGTEGEIQKRGTDKRRAAESAAVGAAVGAAAGAAAGGGKGAIIGAAAGGVLGGGAGILTDRDMVLNKGTQIELVLDRQLQVPN
jgi:hypothetical protein